MGSLDVLLSRSECTQVYLRFPEPDLLIVEDFHSRIGLLPMD